MSVRNQVLNVLSTIQRDTGITYVMIAHDLALIGEVTDELAVMYLGTIVERGPAGPKNGQIWTIPGQTSASAVTTAPAQRRNRPNRRALIHSIGNVVPFDRITDAYGPREW